MDRLIDKLRAAPGDWVQVDARVSVLLDGADLKVSCVDTVDDPDDGHAEQVLAAKGITVSFSGFGDIEGDRYVERLRPKFWAVGASQ